MTDPDLTVRAWIVLVMLYALGALCLAFVALKVAILWQSFRMQKGIRQGVERFFQWLCNGKES